MAQKLRYGFEVGETQVPQGESGKAKVSEVEPIEGKRSLEVPSTAPTTESHRASWTVASGTLPAGANNHDEWLRDYWYCPGDPSADVTLDTWGNLKEGRYIELIHLKSGKLQLKRNGSSVIGETAAKVSVGLHYLERRLRFGTTTGNGQTEARLDGESFAVNNACNLGAGLSHDELRIGVCNSTGGPGELTQRFDSIALNDDQGEKDNSWPGALKPSEAPKVVTGKADGIGGAIATLHGTVNPRGLPTKYWFEIGETKAYGSKTAEVEAGDGEEAVAVKASLEGLKPATTYHYRLVAKNSIGETQGEDGTFKTGPGPSGEPVKTAFVANHEGADPLEEYGSSGIFEKEGKPGGALSAYTPGYGGGKALKAEAFLPDGFARGIATKVQTGWQNGQKLWISVALFLPKGFYEAHQGQIDAGVRADNFDEDAKNTERIGLAIQSTDNLLRLVRIREGEPDEQHTLILGPELKEGVWNVIDIGLTLWHEDVLAHNELWVNDVKIGESSDRNCGRADYEVSRLRTGISATSSKQTNPIYLYVDRVHVGTERLGSLATSVKVKGSGKWKAATRRIRTIGKWVTA